MLSEFQRIELFLSAFPKPRVKVGPGDDCAVVAPSSHPLCITTDAVVEGVHFTLRHFSFQDIGHKALAVNLSDLAAMGARPAWFVCAVACPRNLGAASLRQLATGMARLAGRTGIELIGGNFTSADKLSLTLTVAGEVPGGRVLRRSGARPGDVLFVSGALGGARYGLSMLGKWGAPRAAVKRQRRPEPRLKLGQLARRFASAGIDLSDGLAQDLGHLCRASGVGAQVSLELLPLEPSLYKALGGRARLVAATGGEDYELLLAVPARRAGAFEKAAKQVGEPVSRVGNVTRGPLKFLEDGVEVVAPRGFDHFGVRV